MKRELHREIVQVFFESELKDFYPHTCSQREREGERGEREEREREGERKRGRRREEREREREREREKHLLDIQSVANEFVGRNASCHSMFGVFV